MSQSETQADTAQETGVALSEEEIWAQLEDEGKPEETPEPEAPEKPVEAKASEGEPGQEWSEEEPQEPTEEASAPTEGEEAPPEEQADPQATPEWWNDLSEDARNEIQQTFEQQHQQLQRMQHQYQSLHGKVAPTQRKLDEAIKERDSLKKQLEAYSNAPTSLEELEKTEAFKNLAEDFPEDANALKKAVAQMVAQQEQSVSEKLEQAQRALAEQRQAQTQRELNRLNQAHPDWQEQVNSYHFNVWRSALSPQDQQAVAQMLASPYADENIEVLNAFKRDLQEATGGQTPTQESKPQGSQPSRTSGRPKKRPPSASPPSEGSGVSGSRRTPVPQSDEDLWATVDEDELDKFRRMAG